MLGLLAGSPAPADAAITRLEVAPAEVRINGSDGLAQVIVTGRDERGEPVDLTASARYAVEDEAVASVEAGGLVRPAKDGRTNLKIAAGGKSATVPVVIADMANAKPVHFVGEVVPILTKLGCNAGACHGKSTGQNGFRLSLLGFDPKSDFDALVREGRGRRVFPARSHAEPLPEEADRVDPPRWRPAVPRRLARVPDDRPLDRPGNAVRSCQEPEARRARRRAAVAA